jgi:hypothetical protein
VKIQFSSEWLPEAKRSAGCQQVAQITIQCHLVASVDILTVPWYIQTSLRENAALAEYVIPA